MGSPACWLCRRSLGQFIAASCLQQRCWRLFLCCLCETLCATRQARPDSWVSESAANKRGRVKQSRLQISEAELPRAWHELPPTSCSLQKATRCEEQLLDKLSRSMMRHLGMPESPNWPRFEEPVRFSQCLQKCLQIRMIRCLPSHTNDAGYMDSMLLQSRSQYDSPPGLMLCPSSLRQYGSWALTQTLTRNEIHAPNTPSTLSPTGGSPAMISVTNQTHGPSLTMQGSPAKPTSLVFLHHLSYSMARRPQPKHSLTQPSPCPYHTNPPPPSS